MSLIDVLRVQRTLTCKVKLSWNNLVDNLVGYQILNLDTIIDGKIGGPLATRHCFVRNSLHASETRTIAILGFIAVTLALFKRERIKDAIVANPAKIGHLCWRRSFSIGGRK